MGKNVLHSKNLITVNTCFLLRVFFNQIFCCSFILLFLMYFVEQVRWELDHIKKHQEAKQCPRCAYLWSVIQDHAQTCQMKGTCQVPGCENTR